MTDQAATVSQDPARPPNRVPPAAYAVSPAVQQEVSTTLRTLVSETGIDSALVIRLARELRESRAQNQALIASQNQQTATPPKDVPTIPPDVAQMQRECENTLNANLELQRALTHLNQRYNENLIQLDIMGSKVAALLEAAQRPQSPNREDPQEKIKRLEIELAQSRIDLGQTNQHCEMLRVTNASLQNQLQLHIGRRASSLPVPSKRPEAQSQHPSPHSAQVQLQRPSPVSHPSPTYLMWRNQPSPYSPLGFYAIQSPITRHPNEVNVRSMENTRRVPSAAQSQAPLQSQQQMQPQTVGQQAQAQQQPAQVQQSGSDRTLSYVQQQMQQIQPVPVLSQPPPKKRPQLQVQTQQQTHYQQLQVYSQNLPQQQRIPLQMQPRQLSLQRQSSPQQNSPLRQAHPMLSQQPQSQQDTLSQYSQQQLQQSHQYAESQFIQERLQQPSQFYRTSASRSFSDSLLPRSAPATLPHYITSSPVTASLSPASWSRGNSHTAGKPVANIQSPASTPVRPPEDTNVAETATAREEGLQSHRGSKEDGRASEEEIDVIKDLTIEESTSMEESEPQRPKKRKRTEEPEGLQHPGPLLEASGGPEVITGSRKQTDEIRPAASSSLMDIVSQGPAIPQDTGALPNGNISKEQPLEASESTHANISQYEQEIQIEQQKPVPNHDSHPHFAEIVEVGNIEDNRNVEMSNTAPLDHPEIVELLEFSFPSEGVSQKACAFCRMRHDEDPEGWPTLTVLDHPSSQDMVLHLQKIHTEVWEAVLGDVNEKQIGG